jgi:hypothetical protein
VGAGIGAGASLAQFTADQMRPETSWGSNVGSLLFNLGLDAVSLIPFLGSAAKVGAKTGMLLKQLPKVSKALLGMGLYGAWETT